MCVGAQIDTKFHKRKKKYIDRNHVILARIYLYDLQKETKKEENSIRMIYLFRTLLCEI